MSSIVKGFTSYAREQGVMALAIGIAIGIQASNTVSTIVSNFVDPLVGWVLNGTSFSDIFSTVERNGEVFVFGWGNILQAVVSLLVTALLVYYVVDKTGTSKRR